MMPVLLFAILNVVRRLDNWYLGHVHSRSTLRVGPCYYGYLAVFYDSSSVAYVLVVAVFYWSILAVVALRRSVTLGIGRSSFGISILCRYYGQW